MELQADQRLAAARLFCLALRDSQSLAVPSQAWAAACELPTTSAALAAAAARARAVLHPAFKQLPSPAERGWRAAGTRPRAAQQLPAEPEDEEDEDLARDLHRVRSQRASAAGAAASPGQPAGDLASLDASSTAGPEQEAEVQQQLRGQPSFSSADAAAAAAAATSRPEQQHLQQQTQAVSLAVLSELLHACLSREHMPTLQSIMADAQEQEKAEKEKHAGAGKAAVTQDASSTTKAAAGQGKAAEGSEDHADQPALRWYDARARTALKRVAEWLQAPWVLVLKYETLVAQDAQPPERKEEGTPQGSDWGRYMKIGAAAVGGGALLAVTGGLAAPALAAVAGTAITTVGGSAAAAGAVTGLMGSSAGAAAIIGGFGAGGAYSVGGKMARRIGDVTEFGFLAMPDDGDFHSTFSASPPSQPGSPSKVTSDEPTGQEAGLEARADTKAAAKEATSSSSSWLPSWGRRKTQEPAQAELLLPIPVAQQPRADPRMSLVIGVAGWIAHRSDFVDVWRPLSNTGSERFVLVWETEALVGLNQSLLNFIKSQAVTAAGKYVVEHLIIQGLVAAVALPMTINGLTNIIDNWFSICLNRAELAGKLLAHVLMSGAHGDKPVTLVGYSMGARLIYHTLVELARNGARGIVEHAILLGATVTVVPERFVMARSVVAGRLVNGYAPRDWLLAGLFRTASGFIRPAAGLVPVEVQGIDNIDMKDLISSHFDWPKKMNEVLNRLGLDEQPIMMM